MIVGRMLAWLATAVTAVAVGAWLILSLLVAGGPGVDVLQLLAPDSEVLDELVGQQPSSDDAEVAEAGGTKDSDGARDESAEDVRENVEEADGSDTSIEAGAGAGEQSGESSEAGDEGDAAGEEDDPGEDPEAGAEAGVDDSADEEDEADADESSGDTGDAGAVGGAAGEGEGEGREVPADEGADEDDAVGEGGGADGAADGDVVDDGVPPSVNWPDFAAYDELLTRRPAIQTTHFDLYAVDSTDPVLAASVARWAGQIETFHDYVTSRAGPLPDETVRVLFDRRYEARCPARGLASPGGDSPYLVVFVDESTSDEQVRAVLAHEIAHHVFGVEDFVGDGVLTEGLANWAAGDYALTWQGHDSWADAARSYMAEGSYVSVADEGALTPRDGEDCVARRDRIYNVRAAFVSWMVERYGLDLLRAMPVQSETRLNALSGERVEMDVPDYEAATGRSLTQLEAAWLQELFVEADDGALNAEDAP